MPWMACSSGMKRGFVFLGKAQFGKRKFSFGRTKIFLFFHNFLLGKGNGIFESRLRLLTRFALSCRTWLLHKTRLSYMLMCHAANFHGVQVEKEPHGQVLLWFLLPANNLMHLSKADMPCWARYQQSLMCNNLSFTLCIVTAYKTVQLYWETKASSPLNY